MGHVWDWRDPDGDRIWVRKGLTAAGIAAIGCYDPSDDARVDVTIPHGQAAQVADRLCAAIREAAGLPAPVILDRPDGGARKVSGYMTPAGVVYPFHGKDGPLVAGPDGLFLKPADALPFAAAIATVAAGLAGKEPDPADVEALTQIIRNEMAAAQYDRGVLARAILRAGWRPPERDGGQQ